MAIRVTHPTGATIEFPDGTDETTIAQVMGQFGGQGQEAPDMAQPAKPAAEAPSERAVYSSTGEAIAGAGKSLATGAFQGLLGLATLPGNVESLARSGINAAANFAGVEQPVSPDPFLMDYGEAKGRLEARHGKFYEPKTTPEKYLRTLGEFAAPGGLAARGTRMQRAAQVAAPAVTSEAAGQLTEGTVMEPWARLAGALAGGTVANAGARTVTPAPVSDPVRAAHVATLQKEGVGSLLAGQKTGSSRIRALEDASMTMPGGGRTQAIQQQQLEEFTSAALSKAGIQNATRATPDVIESGFNALGNKYNQVGQVARVMPDPAFNNRLKAAVDGYNQVTPRAQRVPIVGKLAQDIAAATAKPGGMTGQEYLGFRSNMRRAQRKMGDNPGARDALGKLIEHLDSQMVRNAPKNIRRDVAQYMRQLNEEYRNLLAIEGAVNKAGEKSAVGLISPQQLNAELKKQSKRLVSRNSRELGKLATAGDDVLRDLKSSGTAERNQAMAMLRSPSSFVSGVAGGAITGDPFIALASYAAPLAIQAATARGVTNPLFQKWAANQRLTGSVVPNEARNVGFGMAPYLMQEYGE